MTGGSRYAQTNLQLYTQLLADEVDESDVALVAASYEVALPLFARSFRPNGKPFLCHLVGTASVLHVHGAGPVTTAAGLLHAVYPSGEFRSALSATQRRALVRNAVGSEVEGLVHGYAELEWTAAAASAHSARPSSLDQRMRAILAMRLANELEEALDLGLLFSGKGDSAGRRERLAAAAQLADAIGLGGLANEVRSARDDLDRCSVPSALHRPAKGSFRQPVPRTPFRPLATLRSRSVGSIRRGLGRPGSTE